ncbi:uncharacterized protein DS421_14g460720 [Arachis hypogaea]|nr:uncharacterized protein DS421_14g460720 [Arachis hypogaea]
MQGLIVKREMGSLELGWAAFGVGSGGYPGLFGKPKFKIPDLLASSASQFEGFNHSGMMDRFFVVHLWWNSELGLAPSVLRP